MSDAPVQGYTSADHAADLAGLIRGLKLDQPAVGGHSMGAGSTLRLVADHPDLVRCAFLEDPGLRLRDQPARKERLSRREAHNVECRYAGLTEVRRKFKRRGRANVR